MKFNYWILIILVAIMTVAACKSTKKTSEKDADAKTPVRNMIFFDKPFEDLKTDYFDIDSLAVEGQTLAVFVSYGGGCGDAAFEMYYKPQMITVMPHRSSLFLKLIDNDPCRSIISEKLLFDLSVLNKEATTGGVILTISDNELRYQISDE